ncbi:MAG: hypothetical protein JSW04_07780 [Desulfobacterales bacterium]|nr:MAG: hypothetical protein JSW04_07780 [Desulfobacterales bacterium]
MTVKTIYKNRRCGSDRRKLFSINNGIEKRSGVDRRKLDEKLKDMIEHNIKDQNKEKQTPRQPKYGKIIRRRKGEKDKRIFE